MRRQPSPHTTQHQPSPTSTLKLLTFKVRPQRGKAGASTRALGTSLTHSPDPLIHPPTSPDPPLHAPHPLFPYSPVPPHLQGRPSPLGGRLDPVVGGTKSEGVMGAHENLGVRFGGK